MSDPRELPERIIFFDGICALCNRTVDFIVRTDQGRSFRYAALQGETAKTCLDPGVATSLDSIVFREGSRSYGRSDAMLRILERLGGWWRLVRVLRWIPRPIRDAGYDVVARRRYRWFGLRESCRLPTLEERELFLP